VDVSYSGRPFFCYLTRSSPASNDFLDWSKGFKALPATVRTGLLLIDIAWRDDYWKSQVRQYLIVEATRAIPPVQVSEAAPASAV